MLLLVVSGHNGDERDRDGAVSAAEESEGPRELAGGFTTIPEDEFFATVTKAQKASGGWHQAMAVDENDQTVALLSEDIWMNGQDPVMRGTTRGPDGPLVALYVDGAVYLKGVKGQAKPWWKVPDKPAFASLLAFADQGLFLDSVEELEEFEVVGVEQIDGENPDGAPGKVPAVHYTVEVAAQVDDGQGGTTTQPVTMNFWLDQQDRPVQVLTTYTLDGVATETSLVYSDYGGVAPIKAPPAHRVTTKVPATIGTQR